MARGGAAARHEAAAVAEGIIAKEAKAVLRDAEKVGVKDAERTAARDALRPKPREEYEFNMVENPGPLAHGESPPAGTFAGGRYDEVTLTEDVVLYRAGETGGSPFGRFFTLEPPRSVAEVRMDSAVRAQWFDPKTGELTGVSPIDSYYTIRIPAGTKVYPGPVANMGGAYVGGGHQIYIPEPWKGGQVLGHTPLP